MKSAAPDRRLAASRRRSLPLSAALIFALLSSQSWAATGEMGSGKPVYGVYARHQYTTIWSLTDARHPFPQGCSVLYLSAGTLGAEGYKIALSQLTAAKLAGKAVRFYAHAEQDGGCGVDYLQIMD